MGGLGVGSGLAAWATQDTLKCGEACKWHRVATLDAAPADGVGGEVVGATTWAGNPGGIFNSVRVWHGVGWRASGSVMVGEAELGSLDGCGGDVHPELGRSQGASGHLASRAGVAMPGGLLRGGRRRSKAGSQGRPRGVRDGPEW